MVRLQSGSCSRWVKISVPNGSLRSAACGYREATLDCGALQRAIEPAGHMAQRIIADKLARLVEGDQVADPTDGRDIGNAIVTDQPGPIGKARRNVSTILRQPDREIRLGFRTFGWVG